MSKSAIKSMSREKQQSWSCPTCTASKLRLPQSLKDADNQTIESRVEISEPSLADVMTKLNTLLERIDAMERKHEQQLAKLDDTNENIVKQSETITGMQAFLDVLSKQYDGILKSLETHKEEIKDLKKQANSLEDQLVSRNDRIVQLEREVERLQQYSRKANVEIHGIKKTDTEDLTCIVQSIASKLELSVPTVEDIEAVHRIKGKLNCIPPILVRFKNRATRDKWIEKRMVLKDEDIYINENLTPSVKRLIWMTKKRAKEKSYRYVWSRNGRVFVRKEEGATLLRIDSEDALCKII